MYIVYQIREEKAKKTLSLKNVKKVTAFFHKYNMSRPLGICDDFLCEAVALPCSPAELYNQDNEGGVMCKQALFDWTQFATSIRYDYCPGHSYFVARTLIILSDP
jgi:hypothetical protein